MCYSTGSATALASARTSLLGPAMTPPYLFKSKVGRLLAEAAAEGEEVRLVLWASAVVAAAAITQPRGWRLVLVLHGPETDGVPE